MSFATQAPTCLSCARGRRNPKPQISPLRFWALFGRKDQNCQKINTYRTKIASPVLTVPILPPPILTGPILQFCREYIRLSIISAHQLSQLNRDGYSPLHLASANAHLEIVQFMLEFVKQNFAVVEVCMKKDRDGKTALHSAMVSGKIEVIDLLFVNYPDAANEVTFHQETVLHLAVKHHQHEALKFLIDQKLGSSVEGLLNVGDREGNTILHLATANRQFQTVEYLVKL
ncbi:ankyrin repeat-containing protein BDA1-like isoform X2 [Sesamum indicum]|uniref:Ankyrin repeat-containing protein BDA1-like isoform X2 n=1 Tax=Sesamum indicum TaxID=4182 RepID=A0A6I9TE63_SESIN|nr:ankyrin repeat-containing protein BDA1-like isoform X2 [Sesamum indicum]